MGCKKDSDTSIDKDEKKGLIPAEQVLDDIKSILAKGDGDINASVFDGELCYSVETRKLIKSNICKTFHVEDNIVYYNKEELSEVELKNRAGEELTEAEKYELQDPLGLDNLPRIDIYKGSGVINEDEVTIIDNMIFFREYENGISHIKTMNEDGEDVKEICTIKGDIKYITYINKQYICFLRDRNVYAYDTKVAKEIRLNKVENVDAYYPCKYGIIYSCNENKDEISDSIYANDELILKSEGQNYYSIANFLRDDYNKNSELKMPVDVFESKEILVDEYGYSNHENKMIYMDRLFNNFDITKDLIEFDN